jgi:signal transduction histidine kinase
MTTSPIAREAVSAPADTVAGGRAMSLRYRLPLLIATLLTAVGIAFATMAHYEVQRALRINGHQRLTAAVGQVVSLLTQTSAMRVAEIDRIAADPLVGAIVTGTDPARLQTIPPGLRALVARSPQAIISVYGSAGQPIASARAKSEAWEPPAGAALPADVKTGISPLYLHDGHVAFRTVAAIGGSSADTRAGYIAVERALGAQTALTLIERLIGTGASLKIGNAAGDVWTDLNAQVAAPPASRLGEPVHYVNAQGQPRLGTKIAIEGTPWIVWADFSDRELMQPARTLLGRMIPITITLAAIGALVGFGASRRMTLPLVQLASAAEGIANGHYSRRVDASRSDEIGKLGRAFNTMAEHVGQSHQALEDRVQARTAELENTMGALKDAQATLVRRERLAILGQLASSVGHELRNPLGVMTNAVYYLKMVHGERSDEMREYLGILSHQIGLAEKIVADLLDFARLKSPQLQSVDPGTLIEEQLGRLEPAPGVTIDRRYTTPLPAVKVDPVQIGQVLFNLLTNAYQAMSGSGTLTMTATERNGALALDIADNGPGIPPENLAKIFEPLFTTKARGIGLGLAVSRSLATNNGGELTVSSQSGSGARFTLTLPLARRSA